MKTYPFTHPTDDAIVIRFGAIREPKLLKSMLDEQSAANDRFTRYESSVWVSDRLEFESYFDAVLRICINSSALHRIMQLSTIRELKRNNFEIHIDRHIREGVWHANIYLDFNVSEFELRIFIKYFKAPVPRAGV